MYDVFHNHVDIYRYSTIGLNYIFLNHLHSHDICFVNFFDSLIPVIKLKTLRFKFSVLLGTYTLLDKSLRVLQLPAHLSNLAANG